MHIRAIATEWQKTLWKIVTNPAIEVIAAIVVVLLAAWLVVETEVEHNNRMLPVPFGHR
jgi:hypothetical protein